MSDTPKADFRDVIRILAVGTTSYVPVHFILLPILQGWGVSFTVYFYSGVLATGLLAVFLGFLASAPKVQTRDRFGRRTGAAVSRLRDAA